MTRGVEHLDVAPMNPYGTMRADVTELPRPEPPKIQPAPEVQSQYVQSKTIGDKILYFKHIFEGDGAAQKHIVMYLGSGIYNARGRMTERIENIGSIVDFKV